MEATTVSGPAKTLIDFSRRARVANEGVNALPAAIQPAFEPTFGLSVL